MSAEPAKEHLDPRVVTAARRAVEKHGYAGLTLERIAAEADISRVTLHRRGHSKDEIFSALITGMFEEHRDALWPALVAGGNGAERLALAVGKTCDLCERDLSLMLAMRAQLDEAVHAGTNPERQPNWVVTEPFQVLARDGIADGSLRDGDPEVFAALMATWTGTTYVNLRTMLGWRQRRARSVIVDQVGVAFART
jgi:AcrR family transcriptional regulator